MKDYTKRGVITFFYGKYLHNQDLGNIVFKPNSCLLNFQDSIQCRATIGPPAKRHSKGDSLAGRWWPVYRCLLGYYPWQYQQDQKWAIWGISINLVYAIMQKDRSKLWLICSYKYADTRMYAHLLTF